MSDQVGQGHVKVMVMDVELLKLVGVKVVKA